LVVKQGEKMPTLQFKGKNIIWNHHMSVPYHTLERVEELDYQADKGEGNLIVEGDNLTALKALLPQYAGKVKCIYIDPPYNTGNEGWVYNDAANSPIINQWFGKEVNKDDLTRHDKWLCMMTPRLKLLKELLSEDGTIFISIDDIEAARLKLLCDEIFNEENFIAQFVWKSRQNKDNRNITNVSIDHEYVLVYGKRIKGSERDYSQYSNPDNDPRGDWTSANMVGLLDEKQRPNLHYDLIDPETGINYGKPPMGWRYDKTTMERLIKEKKILWPSSPQGRPRRKKFLSELQLKPTGFSSLIGKDIFTRDGTKDLEDLFNYRPLEFPKPKQLIKILIEQATDENDIILDSFAGSGTTGHAVMELNKEDGGNRRYILVQMPENSDKEPDKNICRDITRERIVRAIEKYGYDSGFAYLRVGQALDAETLLGGELPDYETFAKYVYYLATGEHPGESNSIDEAHYYVGSKENEDIYLIYADDMDILQKLALNYEKAEAMRKRSGAKKIIVYAPACFLDEEDLQTLNIEFVSIPYNLFERKAER
jgi:adenine-specific DNA-methyltransferase